jgi:hypothetical protein
MYRLWSVPHYFFLNLATYFSLAAFCVVFIKPRPLFMPGSVPSLWRLLAHFVFLLQAYFLVF